MTNKSELIQARNDLIAALHDKFKDVPEWRAFRAIDKAIASMNGAMPRAVSRSQKRRKTRESAAPESSLSYADLALQAIEAAGRPVPTPEIVNYIAARRQLGRDAKRARVNIQSGLSRDPRIESVPWGGGRAWWHAGRAVPKAQEAA